MSPKKAIRFDVEDEGCCPLCGGAQKHDEKLTIIDDGIFYDGKRVRLSPRMAAVFMALIKRLNKPVSKETIYNDVYGLMPEADWPEIKILDVYMVRLRTGIRQFNIPYTIETVWGTGWRLRKVSADVPRVA